MEPLQIALIAAACAAVFVLTFALFFPALIINSAIFNSRQDKVPVFKYFTAEDFDLKTEPITVSYRGVNLSAHIYTVKPVEECDRVVIFQHGFGAGSSSYMTEIAHFAHKGYAVVAADAYGCNDSAGEKIIGFYAGAEAVIAAYIAVNGDKRLKDKKIILVGHSWGAYSVACAAERVKADGVVAMSGFNAPAQCLCSQLKRLSKAGKKLAPLLHGWFYIINFFKFGVRGNTHAAKALKRSGAKVLIVHGEIDNTVPLKISIAKKCKIAEKLILPDKKHNPYNTVEAEIKLSELSSPPKFADGAEAVEYYAAFDWRAATEEDENIMAKIDNFISAV